MTRQAHHNATASTHPPYWCDECKRAHTGTDADARAILGDRGTLGRVSYVWSHARGAYNLSGPMSVEESQRVALAALSRVINARYVGRTRVRMTWNASHNRKGAPVTVRTGDVDAFAAAYDAQRTRREPMTRGGGNAYALDRNAVPLTQASRRALASASSDARTTDARRAERARDIAALDARIAARDACISADAA